ncbi:Putative ras-associating (RA) domain, sterile alpha motif domain, Ubiquitin-like domain superfamily [Septoria linicola]|uniref:Ras-associating (RA) domain, sterile alpha motif domain, Ubiquitin-like domain superfamily n=1 Tax=Septoria linicola TaxID=215465 RepID=A0A9Q9EHH9_9PEZI|nr:putative ras-associating (RA) domain, sterile alpha motif domain, Ubiquitin-like domain superfamily [Septoria linicola]USW49323.1 Putative ras-associating (RA) domain, sterile alpha motif domain, Ubiquitin-like domain superfamily [Septoria linicola]
MEKYTRQAGDSTYDSDAEADDEFERSVFTSPTLGTHYDDQSDHPSDSEDDHSGMDGEDTPTTQGWADRDGRSPTGKVTQWTEEEVADYVAALSPALKQYGQRFVEEGVNGEALIAIGHDELRELGIVSVGHRLTILKAVYEQKMRAGVKIEEGDYVPLSAEGEKGEMNATQDDIARIIDSLRQRDQRIQSAEAELRAMRDYLERISDENRKLREETLPIMRLVKDQRTPLPDPSGGTIPSPREADPTNRLMEQIQNKGSSLSRKFSTKKLFLNKDGTKQNSPTHPPDSRAAQAREVRDDGGTHLEASAAAMAASSHLTASMTSQTSPNSVHGHQLSPTSPAYSTHALPSTTARSFPQHNQRGHNADNDASYANNHYSQASTVTEERPRSARQQDRARRQAPTPSPREEATPDPGKDNPQVEIFKSFRVSIDDPCRVVLPVALKRYNITDDWRQYALYIVHGDQERCLGLEEKPLLLFKQLDKEGRKPMFMLRRHASPQEGWSNTSGSGAPTHAQEPKQVPGGVL